MKYLSLDQYKKYIYLYIYIYIKTIIIKKKIIKIYIPLLLFIIHKTNPKIL